MQCGSAVFFNLCFDVAGPCLASGFSVSLPAPRGCQPVPAWGLCTAGAWLLSVLPCSLVDVTRPPPLILFVPWELDSGLASSCYVHVFIEPCALKLLLPFKTLLSSRCSFRLLPRLLPDHLQVPPTS